MNTAGKHRAEDDYFDEGHTEGRTVFMGDDEHHTLLGPDGEKLRIQRRAKLGFDLRPRKQRDKA